MGNGALAWAVCLLPRALGYGSWPLSWALFFFFFCWRRDWRWRCCSYRRVFLTSLSPAGPLARYDLKIVVRHFRLLCFSCHLTEFNLGEKVKSALSMEGDVPPKCNNFPFPLFILFFFLMRGINNADGKIHQHDKGGIKKKFTTAIFCTLNSK